MFHTEFQVKPFWWEAYEPGHNELMDVPNTTPVAILGGGYAGLATALELHKLGISSCILESKEPGYGASTRSGGILGGCGAIRIPLINKYPDHNRLRELISAANGGLKLVETIISEENIQCDWNRQGLFKAALTHTHFREMKNKVEQISKSTPIDAEFISLDEQSCQIGSDYYRGGILYKYAGHLHPALYYKGLLKACEKRNIPICAQSEVYQLKPTNQGWIVKTRRGVVFAKDIVIATNGYTGNVTPSFKRRLVPLKAYMIATEPLKDDLANSISSQDLCVTESARITAFFRLSGKVGERRLVFGSRVKWNDITADKMAPLLYSLLIKRFPQMADTKITHAWSGNVALTLDEQPHAGKMEGLHYALGCNGAGVANMTYLGTQIAKKIAKSPQYNCPFDTGYFPTHTLYTGKERWFIPIIGRYFQSRDCLDRLLDTRSNKTLEKK